MAPEMQPIGQQLGILATGQIPFDVERQFKTAFVRQHEKIFPDWFQKQASWLLAKLKRGQYTDVYSETEN